MLDDTRCGLDASSLHRATSMDISLSKNFCLLSCHRDTSSIARHETKRKLRSCLPSLYFYSSISLLLSESPSSSLTVVKSIISCSLLDKDSILEESSSFDLLSSIIELNALTMELTLLVLEIL